MNVLCLQLDVAVFKKTKKGTSSAGSSKGVAASKYYNQGAKPKKGGPQKQSQDVYDNMMTPRNVKYHKFF